MATLGNTLVHGNLFVNGDVLVKPGTPTVNAAAFGTAGSAANHKGSPANPVWLYNGNLYGCLMNNCSLFAVANVTSNHDLTVSEGYCYGNGHDYINLQSGSSYPLHVLTGLVDMSNSAISYDLSDEHINCKTAAVIIDTSTTRILDWEVDQVMIGRQKTIYLANGTGGLLTIRVYATTNKPMLLLLGDGRHTVQSGGTYDIQVGNGRCIIVDAVRFPDITIPGLTTYSLMSFVFNN